ncbi:hypothetical protein D3C84_1182890 [compost metagenome]
MWICHSISILVVNLRAASSRAAISSVIPSGGKVAMCSTLFVANTVAILAQGLYSTKPELTAKFITSLTC